MGPHPAFHVGAGSSKEDRQGFFTWASAPEQKGPSTHQRDAQAAWRTDERASKLFVDLLRRANPVTWKLVTGTV